MKTGFLLSTACAALLLGAGPSLADDDAPAPKPDVADAGAANSVDTVVVSATRSAQAIDKIGASVTVIDKATLESRQTVVVSDLLAQTPGVSVTRNGGVGQPTSLRIRGAETDQTVVVIDGVKLNDPSATGGGYNTANLLSGDISRIEVLRGAQSTLWGSQAIGGVVNIVTAQPTAPFEASATVEGGSMATGLVKAVAGGAGDRLTWRLGASQFTTEGVSAYRLGAERDGYRNTGLSGRANIKLADDVSLDLRGVYSKAHNDFDGFPPPAFVFADTAEYNKTTDLVGYAGLNFGLFEGRLENRAGFGYTRTDRKNFDPAQAVTTKTFDAQGQNRRYEYQGVFAITDDWNATFGAEREDSKMRTASPSSFAPNPTPLRASAVIDSVYGQAQGTVAPGLTLTGGLRHDDHNTFGGHTLGQAAAAWSLNDGATVLRASFGQGFKAPTLYQLYSEYGNLALRPERADAWDAGVQQRLADGRVSVSATYFHRRTTDQIDFVSCSAGSADPLCAGRFGYYANIARTRAQGLELAGAGTLGPVAITANYTWTQAKNDAAGSPNHGRLLALRPEHQANLAADWQALEKLRVGASVEYVGDSFNNAANTQRLKGRTLVDLRTAYSVTDRFEVYGRVENLTNQDYQTIANYGSPRRAAYVGVRARF